MLWGMLEPPLLGEEQSFAHSTVSHPYIALFLAVQMKTWFCIRAGKTSADHTGVLHYGTAVRRSTAAAR